MSYENKRFIHHTKPLATYDEEHVIPQSDL